MQKISNEIIDKLDAKLNVKHDTNNTVIHLMEETGEIFKELGRPAFRHQGLNKEELGDEISDVMMFLMRLAELYNIDMNEAFKRKAERLRKRWDL